METRAGALKKKEEAPKKLDRRTKRIRASAAGSSSPPHQPPPPGPATHVHQLPDEVLEKIFTLLSLKTIVNVLSVCHRWRVVIEDRNRIKKLKFKDDTFTTQEALCLIDSAQGLKLLELRNRSDTVALLDAVSARCTNLLKLSVRWCNVSDSALTDTFTKVFHTSPHITDLRLRYTSTSKNLRFCRELGAALPDLRKVVFSIPQLSDLELDALIDSCSLNQMEDFEALSNPCSDAQIAKLVQFWGRSLRVLELNASKLTDGALARLGGCSELRRLMLLSLSPPGDWLHGLATLSHLEELYVSHETEIEQAKWCRFFSQSQSGHGLRSLGLKASGGVDDRVLASVAAFCLQLEVLYVTGTDMTISGVREVLRCCRKLHALLIASMDDSVADIVLELPQLAPQLRRICISDDAKRRLGEDTLRGVQAQMPHLGID